MKCLGAGKKLKRRTLAMAAFLIKSSSPIVNNYPPGFFYSLIGLICFFQARHVRDNLQERTDLMHSKRFSVLPGFNLTMGFTVLYLSALVLIPFGALVIRASELTWADFWRLATSDRALASYRLTFGASLIASVANAVFGTL